MRAVSGRSSVTGAALPDRAAGADLLDRLASSRM